MGGPPVLHRHIVGYLGDTIVKKETGQKNVGIYEVDLFGCGCLLLRSKEEISSLIAILNAAKIDGESK
jgi:hypothetical protein